MKPQITLELGRESTESEVGVVSAAFASYFQVETRAEIIRLSDEILPMLIVFTVSAVADGVYWDSIKAAIGALFNAYQAREIKRRPVLIGRYKTRQYIITPGKIVEKSKEEEVKFNSLEEFAEYMKYQDNEE